MSGLVPRPVRRGLDWMVSTPRGGWFVRLVGVASFCLLGIAARDVVVRRLPSIQRLRSELSDLEKLESEVERARLDSAKAGDSVQVAAWNGTFDGWLDLAAWLEDARKSADRAEADLEWTLIPAEVADPERPGLHPVRIDWSFSPTEPDLASSMAFVRRLVGTRGRKMSLESLGVESDEIGLRTIRFRTRVWVRSDRG